MFRKTLSLTMCLAAAVGVFASCGSANAQGNSDKPQIICTIFPEYDWTLEILGEHADEFDITYLLTNGSDLHSYQPTVDDIVKISNCDMFIYVGGESDEWAEDALESAANKDMYILNLMDILGSSLKEEELKDGMQEDDEEEEGDEPEYDEHVWLSLKNAETICGEISSTLCSLDPGNAADYKKNEQAYYDKLAELDEEYRAVLSSASEKNMIFGDRFPFRYLVDDYGLGYYAAFKGCSAETEASFETITFLAEKADELNAKTIFTIEGSDISIAEAVISSTKSKNQQILSLNSIQSVTDKQINSGISYLSIMRDNLNVLKEALD